MCVCVVVLCDGVADGAGGMAVVMVIFILFYFFNTLDNLCYNDKHHYH